MAGSQVSGPARHGSQEETVEVDSLGPMAEGLATALQWYGDSMGEKLASLSREQSVLLAKLEAAREASCFLSCRIP